jgi:glycosyltransferase involved in cell wall biosynthesis
MARILWEQSLQRRVLARLQPQLYHALAFVSPPQLSMPSVVTVYDLSFIHYPQALGRARRWYLETFTPRSCQQAQRIIAISRSTAQDVSQTFGIAPDKISVAVPGVDPRFSPLPAKQVQAFRAQQGLPERFFLHLGTLEPRKNLVLLIQAYADLPAQVRHHTPLILAGGRGWDYDPIFQAIERYGLQDQVRYVGYVNSADLPLWYNAALALVYPSLFEGWGLPVVEAMACGCPIIVSDSASLPEAAGQAGLCLPAHDQAAWSAALRRASDDSQWRAGSRQDGLQRARQFTWQQTAQATLTAYREVLGYKHINHS